MKTMDMNWRLAYAHHETCKYMSLSTIADVEHSGLDIIPATVPGNLELDLMRAGKMEDVYFSTNTLKVQELEDVHLWYYTTVNIQSQNQYLCFDGIDTFADIYVNGKLVKSTDNMFLSYDVFADWIIGENEVVVHIKPTMLEARKYDLPARCYTFIYNYGALHVRKAAHMFGWDIMPRMVSAGIWKPVHVKEKKADRIREVYLGTNFVNLEDGTAQLRLFLNVDMSGARATDYTIRFEAKCGESKHFLEKQLWHNSWAITFDVKDCKFWWPKNAGAPNLYDVKITLLRKGEVCDTYCLKYGIRTIELDRTDITDMDGNGEFCFRVNGKKIFVLGTNWVPLDALHSNDANRLPKALEMLDDIGCNMVRCWGGNVYESDEFFDFCDEHGILVWQDFGLGCAIYPEDEEFKKALEEEAVYQIKRLRNHASLALWAGDNEIDVAHNWSGYQMDPTTNYLNRTLLKRAVEMHDYIRPYLPSSPFITEKAFRKEGIMPEEHLWGPRDYFKGNFYKNTFCHFASETGYHAYNSPQSLKRFLENPEKIFNADGTPTDEYIVHGANAEADPEAPYAYRLRLAHNQVVTLFGHAEENFDDFLRQSQISQAEAKKYFIEKFRVNKWKRTGIIWWNLLDGWPQVSDAIVDYYFVKKLAYHYIKRSQEPVCLIFDEPEDGKIRLVGVNDLPQDVAVNYTVKRINADSDEEVMSGTVTVDADSAITIDFLEMKENEKEFYLIEWQYNGKQCKNHYFTNIIDIDYGKYMAAIRKCGMDEFDFQ